MEEEEIIDLPCRLCGVLSFRQGRGLLLLPRRRLKAGLHALHTATALHVRRRRCANWQIRIAARGCAGATPPADRSRKRLIYDIRTLPSCLPSQCARCAERNCLQTCRASETHKASARLTPWHGMLGLHTHQRPAMRSTAPDYCEAQCNRHMQMLRSSNWLVEWIICEQGPASKP